MAQPGTTSAEGSVDCVVVGAGPVGLVSALLLAQEGWRVVVLERWPDRFPMPRACTIDHEALRILQAAGLMDEYRHLFEPSRGARGGYQIRNADGQLLRAIDWNRDAESGWANTNGFYQPDLEEALERMLERYPNVEVQRGWTVVALTQSPEAVTVEVVATEGHHRRRRLSAAWTIGADGANSAVRELVGIPSTDSGFEADWLVVDYRPRVDREWDAFVTQYCDPAQPATAVKSGPGRRRFEFMRPPGMSRETLAEPRTAWRLMQPWEVTPQNADLERNAVYTFRGRWAQDWIRRRVILAGDAAHLMPPFLGQGLCAGLRDARALTWRLALIHRGRADPRILDTYTSERREHVKVIIDEAVAIGQVICETDPVRAAARDAAMLAELADPARHAVEPPHPRLGEPSTTSPGSDVVGRLAVQGQVRRGGHVGLFDDVVGGSWQLIGWQVDPATWMEATDLEWFRSIGGSVTSIGDESDVEDVDGIYERWFERHGCDMLLARPDFYVFGAGHPEDLRRWIADLRRDLLPIHPERKVHLTS